MRRETVRSAAIIPPWHLPRKRCIVRSRLRQGKWQFSARLARFWWTVRLVRV
jgi:hypothetical protein